MIEDLGHVVTEVSSAEEALSALEHPPLPELIITDHAMPGMTGLALAKLLRDRFPGLPVVIATGYAELTQDDSSDAFLRLSKPFRQSELSAVMSKVLALGRPGNGVGANGLVRDA